MTLEVALAAAARQPAELELDASGTRVHQYVGHPPGAWADVELHVRDRRSHRTRVPRRREGRSRSGAGPARRWEPPRGVAVAVGQDASETTYPASGMSATVLNSLVVAAMGDN